jgi:diguanylate cyclase (GGDEF)-like protein
MSSIHWLARARDPGQAPGGGGHTRSFAFRLRAALTLVVAPCVVIGLVSWIGLGRAVDQAVLRDDTVDELATISALQRELRHADAEVNHLAGNDDPQRRDELSAIMLTLDEEFARATAFDRDAESEIAIRAERYWRGAELIIAPWLAAPHSPLTTASLMSFHRLVDSATSELAALEEQTSTEATVYSEQLRHYRAVLVWALAAGAVVTAWVARRLRLAIYRPLRQLESSLDRIDADGLRDRVEVAGDREFHAVADAFNEMSDRLQNTVRQLERQAFHDPLTGLPNRAMLEKHLSVVLAGQPHAAVGLVVLDLDDFKVINDGLGHAAGDAVLIAMGQRLGQLMGADEMIGRLGGDEFAVVVTDMTAARVDEISECLAAAYKEPVAAAGRSLLIDGSAGAAIAQPGDTAADLFRHADIALFSAKDAGKGCLRVFEPRMLERVEERHTTETELRLGIGTGQIEVHYQPTICTRTGLVMGVEALARWNHPTRGLLAPWAFISVAEHTGLIVPLGQVVLEQACHQVATWHQTPELERLSLSVNVSARQLRNADIVDQVRTALADSGLPARYLVLEVTESIAADADAIAVLNELRGLGIRIALDDFGTGYSSLSYLQLLPIDVLKIDKSFVDDIQTQASRAALVGAIIRLGRSFGLEVVAEGVEEEEQLLLLRQLECDLVQGYLLARPAAPDAIEATLLALSSGAETPQQSTTPPGIDTVTVRIGPVVAASATAWLDYLTTVLDRIKASGPDHHGIPAGVLAAIDMYVTIWGEVAATNETFLWTGREDRGIVRAVAHYWFEMAGRLTGEALATGRNDLPPAGQPFYDALMSAILVALAVGGEGEIEAEAIAWQMSWPHAPVQLSDGLSAAAPIVTSIQ